MDALPLILFVCTGNTCRSPMAEGLLRHHLREAGLSVATASAGTLGWNDNPATPHAVEVLAERGVDIAGHISRRLDGDEIRRAVLVVAMTRVHAWAVAAHDPTSPPRTFLLGEVVRLGSGASGPAAEGVPAAGGRNAGDRIAAWVAGLHAVRPEGKPLGRAAEEVADPAGEGIEVYRATAERLDRQVRALVALLTAVVVPRGAGG